MENEIKTKTPENISGVFYCKHCKKQFSEPNYINCFECRLKNKSRVNKYIQKLKSEHKYSIKGTRSCKKDGYCSNCWKKLPENETRKICEFCRTKVTIYQQNRREKRRKSNCCMQCGNPEIITTGKEQACYICYLKHCALKNLGSSKRWKELDDKLQECNFKCYYTGKDLKLGDNASVDHKYPKFYYPELKHKIDNIEWVDIDINTMKRAMTKEEFLSLIHQISDYTKKIEPVPGLLSLF